MNSNLCKFPSQWPLDYSMIPPHIKRDMVFLLIARILEVYFQMHGVMVYTPGLYYVDTGSNPVEDNFSFFINWSHIWIWERAILIKYCTDIIVK